MKIIERDVRLPKTPLRDVGGIAACAVGDLDGARATAARTAVASTGAMCRSATCNGGGVTAEV